MALMPVNHRVKIEERPRILLDSGYEIIEDKSYEQFGSHHTSGSIQRNLRRDSLNM